MQRDSSTETVLTAKTDATGFLHLPNEIRNRIYEDVIWSHDREAVYLPRKLPRKVLYDGEKISDSFMGLADRAEYVKYTRYYMDTIAKQPNSEMDCLWIDETRPPEEIPLPIFTEEETDDETETDQATSPEKTQLWRNMFHKDKLTFSWLDTRELAASREQDLGHANTCAHCGEICCVCIDSDDSEEDEDAGLDRTDSNYSIQAEDDFEEDDEGEMFDEDGYLIPPKACFEDHGVQPFHHPCRFCGDAGLRPDQDEEAYVDSEPDNDDPLEEDEEHFDSEERMGMLFRTQEPSLLLACKEIREQCLPLYYASNAFSWRFFWLDQYRSLARFEKWTQSVSKNAKYITRISFEGRHSVEEGIEFEVDIDLLDEAPFFDLAVDCIHAGDELTDVIEEAIEQDFVTALWKLSKYHKGVIKLSSTELCHLGTLFSEALQR